MDGKAAKLPVEASLPELAQVLAERGLAVLSAPPGAGKTTRVPVRLMTEPWCTGRILVLEPRRLAARAAARFVAAEMGEKPGQTVGYRVRLESCVSSSTRIEFVTEGVFTRMALGEPELSGVSAVVFDEFHERSLDADLGLALALDIQGALRPDLRLLVMSATLDIARLAAFLGHAPVIESHGRAFPVDIRYAPRPPGERIEQSVARAIVSALATERGSVLAFLPGQAEIRRTAESLAARLPDNTELHPLHGGLDAREQDAAILPAPPGRRKVVLATAIAETSLTIDGVAIVVDSGLARVPRYEPRTGLTRLETVRASKFSVDQRAGRAGRTGPGIAIRLWHEGQNAALTPSIRPEIVEADLSSLALDLAAWGTAEPGQLRWLDPPPAPAWEEAIAMLTELGALDGKAHSTALGRRMREMPLAPRFARMVLRAADYGQAEDAAELSMLVSERGLGGNAIDLAHRLERLRSEKGQRVRAARRAAAGMIRDLPRAGSMGLSPGALLSLAWPERIARLRGPRAGFVLANGRGAAIDDSESLAQEPFLAVADLQGAAASARIVSAAAITLEEIELLHGDRIEQVRDISLDKKSGTVRARLLRRLGALTLSQANVEIAAEEAREVLFAAIREKGLAALTWDKRTRRLRQRMDFIHRHVGSPWPDVGEAALLDGLENWLAPFLDTPRSLADIGPGALLEGLGYLLAQQGKSISELEAALPETFTTPAGSRIPLRYEADEVVLPVRVQELYGLTRHPSIADGTISLTLELLSPAHRPIQITRDLPGFWAGSWADVRAQMRGRYPKHSWPENPASAEPTSRAKPRGT